jgi:hypothetical protein
VIRNYIHDDVGNDSFHGLIFDDERSFAVFWSNSIVLKSATNLLALLSLLQLNIASIEMSFDHDNNDTVRHLVPIIVSAATLVVIFIVVTCLIIRARRRVSF